MTGTITTRAGERQRARGGLHPFFGAQGAASTQQSSGDGRGEAGAARPLPYGLGLLPLGREFLDRIFSHTDDDEWDAAIDAPFWRPSDEAWIRKRVAKLAPWSEGKMRVVPQVVWDLATLLQHPQHRRATFKRFARRVPADFLAMATTVALLNSKGDMRALSSRRATSILAIAILLWLLAEPDPHGGAFGYVVRGLPYGTWCHLLARFEDYGSAERVVPHVNTVWGTHRPEARYDRAENGYMAALRQAGVIKTKQPPWWTVPAGRRGVPHYNGKGERECWAFVEIRLRIPAPGAGPLAMGPPDAWVRFPPIAPPVAAPPGDVIGQDAPQWLFVPPEPQLNLPPFATTMRTDTPTEHANTASAEDENIAIARAVRQQVRQLAESRNAPSRPTASSPTTAAMAARDDEELEVAREALKGIFAMLESKKPPKPG